MKSIYLDVLIVLNIGGLNDDGFGRDHFGNGAAHLHLSLHHPAQPIKRRSPCLDENPSMGSFFPVCS